MTFAQTGVLSWDGMEIPMDFPYMAAILQGPPSHDHDEFSLRHPKMECGKRAKIFAPFDALDGYSDAVKSKNVEYIERIELSEEQREELNRRLTILYNLTCTRRLARQNHVAVTVTYYVPCDDENNFSYGLKGQYRTVTGICRNVDYAEETITVDETAIYLDSVAGIESAWFDKWEDSLSVQ